MFLPLSCIVDLETNNGLMPVSCRTAYDAKETAYRAWCRAHNDEHLGQFVLARDEAKRVYGSAK